MIDWIELIPFEETRNYVQRVLENVVIYRARTGEATPTLLAQWTR
jgi:soluble lytic murein transglycosylase